MTKPIDKRVYKGTCPTCHDFGPPGCLKNEHVRYICHNIKRQGGLSLFVQVDVTPLLVGFSGGQIQLIDPVRKELSRSGKQKMINTVMVLRNLVRLYNEERLVDKSRVTCVKWVPGQGDTFLVSHASGHLYTYQVTGDIVWSVRGLMC